MKARKKPVEVEVVLWDGTNLTELKNFVGKNLVDLTLDNKTVIMIDTLEGLMKASTGDFIIKGVEDEFYPCKPDIFYKTYEVLDSEPPKPLDWETLL